MTKEKQEDIISNQIFHQWKHHDCTKALINLIEDSIKIGEKSITEHVKSNKEINVQALNCFKGSLKELYELLSIIQDKTILENYLNNKEETNDN